MKKHVRSFVVLVLVLSAMFLMTSCAKKKVTQVEPVIQPEPEVQKVVPDTSKEDAEMAARLLEESRLREERLREAAEKAFLAENIHFESNSSILSEKAQRILKSKADYLRNNSDVKITVEGHCDERGTETYNNGLGKRRAESVKKSLVDQGISTDRLVTASYGERNPIALGHDEASWAKNRRVQMVVNLVSADYKSKKN
jgi:peptidoglycan-associated lipoprotein